MSQSLRTLADKQARMKKHHLQCHLTNNFGEYFYLLPYGKPSTSKDLARHTSLEKVLDPTLPLPDDVEPGVQELYVFYEEPVNLEEYNYVTQRHFKLAVKLRLTVISPDQFDMEVVSHTLMLV